MVDRIRQFDWSATPVGSPATWPEPLRIAINICLASRFPMMLWWGRELTYFYNDGYARVLGKRHPDALGRSGKDVWHDVWPQIEADTNAVFDRGESSWHERTMLYMERNGFREETWFTWSYSPIFDSQGNVGGLFNTCHEETAFVLSERAQEQQRAENERLHREANQQLEERVRQRTEELANIQEHLRVAEISRQSELQFHLIANMLPQMIWVTRPDGHHEWYNRRWYEFTGVPEGTTDGEGWSGMFHPDDQQRAWARWRHCLATGEPYEIEYRLRHRSGRYLWVLGRALPLRDENGVIQRWFGTCTDIDEIRRLTAEREQLLASERQARADAESASHAKDRFLAVLSHELRTPLSPVLLTLPVMQADPETPAKLRDDLAMIRRNIELEVMLIDDLLDLSRVAAGKLRLHPRPVHVHDVLRFALHSARSENAGKHLTVRQTLNATNDLVNADPLRLQQILWNLLRNAMKFTGDGGEIEIRTEPRTVDGKAIISVEIIDTGVGIAADVLPRLFRAFEQGSPGTTRQFGGLGLGLAIAKALVEMHGGTITASSDGLGHGATFRVELELLPAAVEPTPPAPVQLPSPAQVGKTRVLLVEDHHDTALSLARLLRYSGYEVQIANSVAGALQFAAKEPFDIVVSDIGLPDATGYDLMQQLRDRHGLRGIALTGFGMEDDVRRSRDAGFSDHIVKPINVTQLEAVLQRVAKGQTG
jgi:PAS domain S-box-containing protein